MVLSGRVSFYGEGDICYGEFGPMEGIMMPHNNRYWFDSVSDADAEILQVLHFDRDQGVQRDDHAMPKYSKEDVRLFYGGTRSKK